MALDLTGNQNAPYLAVAWAPPRAGAFQKDAQGNWPAAPGWGTGPSFAYLLRPDGEYHLVENTTSAYRHGDRVGATVFNAATQVWHPIGTLTPEFRAELAGLAVSEGEPLVDVRVNLDREEQTRVHVAEAAAVVKQLEVIAATADPAQQTAAATNLQSARETQARMDAELQRIEDRKAFEAAEAVRVAQIAAQRAEAERKQAEIRAAASSSSLTKPVLAAPALSVPAPVVAPAVAPPAAPDAPAAISRESIAALIGAALLLLG